MNIEQLVKMQQGLVRSQSANLTVSIRVTNAAGEDVTKDVLNAMPALTLSVDDLLLLYAHQSALRHGRPAKLKPLFSSSPLPPTPDTPAPDSALRGQARDALLALGHEPDRVDKVLTAILDSTLSEMISAAMIALNTEGAAQRECDTNQEEAKYAPTPT